jgi:hypothetical protein
MLSCAHMLPGPHPAAQPHAGHRQMHRANTDGSLEGYCTGLQEVWYSMQLASLEISPRNLHRPSWHLWIIILSNLILDIFMEAVFSEPSAILSLQKIMNVDLGYRRHTSVAPKRTKLELQEISRVLRDHTVCTSIHTGTWAISAQTWHHTLHIAAAWFTTLLIEQAIRTRMALSLPVLRLMRS